MPLFGRKPDPTPDDRDPNADPDGPRPNRPRGHHCRFATDGDGQPILTNWADCTCDAGADHT